MEKPNRNQNIDELREAQPQYRSTCRNPSASSNETSDEAKNLENPNLSAEEGLELMSPEVRQAYLQSVERFGSLYKKLAQ